MKLKSFLLLLLLTMPTIAAASYCDSVKVPVNPFPLRYSIKIVSTQPNPPRPPITVKTIVVQFFTTKFSSAWPQSIKKIIYHENTPNCIHAGCIQRQDDLVINVPHDQDKLFALPGEHKGVQGHWVLLDQWGNVHNWGQQRVLTAFCYEPELWKIIKSHFPLLIFRLP